MRKINVQAGPQLDMWLKSHPMLRDAVRSAVKNINEPFAKERFRKHYARRGGIVKLEIGGRRQRDGWLVTDVGPLAPLYLDVTHKWPVDSDSVDIIFSDNVIEHLSLSDGRKMLAEAQRCLKPGGVLRLVTPDLRAHIEIYSTGHSALESPAALHYRRGGQTVEHPLDLVRIPIASFGHHAGYVYDFESLSLELRNAGFKDVKRCQLGFSENKDLMGLDSRTDSGEAQMAAEAIA